jgi:hypothetical protein
MTGVLAAWLIEIGILTYRDVKAGSTVAGLPPAGDFLASFVIFGGLALVPRDSQGAKVATAVAWGYVAATVLNLYDPTNPTKLGPKAADKVTAQKAKKQGANLT